MRIIYLLSCSNFFIYLEHEMEQMEEGKEFNIGNVDNIICHEELQSEVINPEMNQLHDPNLEIIEDISTIQDSHEVLCQSILLDILEKIFKQPLDPGSEVVAYNHQKTNQNDDEILQMNVEEIIQRQIPLMKESIFQDIVKDKPSTLPSQPPQKITKRVKGKHSE